MVLLSLALLVSTGSLAASQGVMTAWAAAPSPQSARYVTLAPDEPDDNTVSSGSWLSSISRAARQFQGLQHQLLAILHGGNNRVTPTPVVSDELPQHDQHQGPPLCLVRDNLLNLPPPAQA